MLFQDGALTHFHKDVTDFINHKFPEKQACSGGPITLPPFLPNLMSFDFFLLGVHQGSCVCATAGTTLPELAGRIQAAVAAVPTCLMCRLKLNTNMIYARPLTISTLKTCKM
jgi:hypothetical protein